ncbi:hypothetical protein HAX54_029042, partial [Datura stramonium]|nr:hypothetical protein [Datura stramonium]
RTWPPHRACHRGALVPHCAARPVHCTTSHAARPAPHTLLCAGLKWDNLLGSQTGQAHRACNRTTFVPRRAMHRTARPVCCTTCHAASPAPCALHCTRVPACLAAGRVEDHLEKLKAVYTDLDRELGELREAHGTISHSYT